MATPRFSLEMAGLGLDVFAPQDLDFDFFRERSVQFGASAGAERAGRLFIEQMASAPASHAAPGSVLVRRTDEGWVVECEAAQVVLPALGDAVRARIAPDKFAVGFENALRLWCSRRIVERGGLLLHAAGIVNGSRGFAFPGVSGTGKSTLTLREPDTARISEDMLAVRPDGDSGWFMESLPFFAANRLPIGRRRATLHALAFITKGSGARARACSPDDTLKSLARAVVSFVPQDIELELLNRMLALRDSVPACELTIDRATPFWPELLAALSPTQQAMQA